MAHGLSNVDYSRPSRSAKHQGILAGKDPPMEAVLENMKGEPHA